MAENQTNSNDNIQPDDSKSFSTSSRENRSASNIDHNPIHLNDDEYKTLEESATEISNIIIDQITRSRRRINGLVQTEASSSPSGANAEADASNSRINPPENSVATSASVEPVVPSPPLTTASHPEPRVATITTNNNQQSSSRSPPPPHIMISYNHETASVVCQAIYDRLIERGYNVWFDKHHLHGSVLDAMGEAVDNAYVVLLCINVKYSQSPFCLREAKYAVETRTPVIPCMMEENFRPRGGLGIIKCDLKHIEFFYEDQFDDKFELLINEIKAIEVGLGMRPEPLNNFRFRARFNEIISQDLISIQNLHLHRGNLGERDFGQILHRLVQELSPETLQSFNNDRSVDVDGGQNRERTNDRLIEHVLDDGRDLEELVRRQQQQYDNQIRQRFLEQSDRLKAFIDFQAQQNARSAQRERDQQEQLSSLFHIQQEQQQHYANLQQQFAIQNESWRVTTNAQQERNDRISERLIQHVEQLTELIIQQQEQHARHTASLNQMLDLVSETSSATQQQQQPTRSFDFDMFNKVVQTILLCGTIFILLRKT